MSTPVQEIEVVCPKCVHSYRTHYRASMNLRLDPFSAEYIERMSTGVCPNCGEKVSLGSLVVRPDGVWELGPRSYRSTKGPDGKGDA